MPKILLLFFDAGGGHRSAATALQAVCEQYYPEWDVELVNIGKELEPLDFFHRYLGIAGEDIYNGILQRGLTLGSHTMLRITQAIIRINSGRVRRFMREFWRKKRPDMVVSLIPNFNRPLFQSLQEAYTAEGPAPAYVTLLTDIADFPPHFWMEKQRQYLVCGSERAVEQAATIGYEAWQIRRASGMILQPRFYETKPVDIPREREQLGLRPDLPTALVLFGGHGGRVMNDIYDQLSSVGEPLQAIFLCGKNTALAERLKARKDGLPIHVEGFTREVPRFMQLADFFIGKPGPGSISEAIHMNLPVIVQRNAWTLPQERYNTEWVEQKKLGIVIPHFRQTAQAVRQLLTGDNLNAYRARTKAIENKAVYEAPKLLDEILRESTHGGKVASPANGKR